MIRPVLTAIVVAAPAYLFVALVFAAVNHFNRKAAARVARPQRLPQQLTTRTQDFDERGRPW